eukprot:5321956-Prymnesium_polylepis.1
MAVTIGITVSASKEPPLTCHWGSKIGGQKGSGQECEQPMLHRAVSSRSLLAHGNGRSDIVHEIAEVKHSQRIGHAGREAGE